MSSHGKRYRAARESIDREQTYTPLAALRLEKGSGEPNREKVGRLTRAQLQSIAEAKMPDLNARDVEQAMLIVAGTARSMGVETDL